MLKLLKRFFRQSKDPFAKQASRRLNFDKLAHITLESVHYSVK